MIRFHTDDHGLRSCVVESVSLIETFDGLWLITISRNDEVKDQQWVDHCEGLSLYENLKVLTSRGEC